ncbi:MAG: hypothetical protein ACT4OU_07770 [Hyphomicrobium sp.]
MSSRHVGLACALPVVAAMIAGPPSSRPLESALRAAPPATVAVAISPLNLSKLDLADFGDVEALR